MGLIVNNQAVMALAKRLITQDGHDHNDSWAYYDYGVVQMAAEITGLSEREVVMQLNVGWDVGYLIEFILDVEI